MEENMKEPTLEEYGLDIPSYLKHREHINSLIKLRESHSFSFWTLLFILLLPVLLISYFFFNLNIIFLIFVGIFTLLIYKAYSDL